MDSRSNISLERGFDMSDILIPITVLLPLIGGVLVPVLPFKKLKHMHIYVECLVILTSIMVGYLLFNKMEVTYDLVRFTGDLSISLRIDGLGSVFCAMVAFLWPFVTLYAFEYMKHEGKEKSFFMFFTMTYGVTLGIASSANLVTMYCFYEMLTLVTLPLVMHTGSREAVLASRKYLYYSLGGAAFAFIGLIFMITYGSTDFAYGGTLNLALIGSRENILRLVYVMAFMGFGVKAAIFPFSEWLPQAGVAPTPVTGLLHAVAVVKAGAFATMRLTYYCFGTEFLRGSWAQYVILGFTIFTIVYGCSRALKETHMKRRLAYSTVSNLSYILFGVALMSPLGLIGALCHMICHAFMKLLSFLCAGAVIVQSEKTFVHQLDGMGKKMPQVFTLFTISGLALMGVPGLCGFVSKWHLVKGALADGGVAGAIGVGALLISALLTANYMMTIAVRAFAKEGNPEEKGGDPTWRMMIPLYIFTAFCVLLGVCCGPLVSYFGQIASGLI